VRRLRDVGEHGWIARLVARLRRLPPDRRVLVGPGDDAAAVRGGRRPLLLTTDTLVAGVHFRHGWLTPAALGRRAFAVNASDLAAMGGVPAFALLSLEAPARTPVAEVDAVVRGFTAAAARSGARLVGGNLAAGPRLALAVTLVGTAPGRIVTRGGARPGDLLWVTGDLGGTGAAVRRLRAGRPGRLPHPPGRVPAGRLLAQVAGAMIDVSDGLLQDVGHLCRASGVAAEVDVAALPVSPACRRALGGGAALFAAGAGEDYELVVAVPRRHTARLMRLAPRLGCRLTRIGRIVPGRPRVRLLDPAGRAVRPPHPGYDHFRR
jgi:thiamine-monophosphate kinase